MLTSKCTRLVFLPLLILNINYFKMFQYHCCCLNKIKNSIIYNKKSYLKDPSSISNRALNTTLSNHKSHYTNPNRTTELTRGNSPHHLPTSPT